MIGGSGVISTDIVEESLRQGHNVTILTRGTKTVNRDVEHIQCNAKDPEALIRCLSGRNFDVVSDFISFTPEDLLPKLRAVRGHCQQYMFISSAAVYDRGYGAFGTTLSAIPPYKGLISEDRTPTANFGWNYARDKIACEHELLKEHILYGGEFTIIRPAETYNRLRVPGTFVCDHAWYTQIDRMLRGAPTIIHDDGAACAPFTHAADFARAYTGLYLNPKAFGQAFHIATEELITWRGVAETIARLLGVEPNLCFIPSTMLIRELPVTCLGDTYGTIYTSKRFDCPGYDQSKLRDAVPDFSCRISFEEGMRRTLSYYADHPEARRIDSNFNAAMDRLADLMR